MACTTKRAPRKNNRNFAILTNPINAPPVPRPRRRRPECATSDGVYYEARVICRAARFLSPVYYIVVEKSVFFSARGEGKNKNKNDPRFIARVMAANSPVTT